MLFPVRDALWYLQRMPLGEFRTGSKASQGDAFYIADNPPFGAVISYYLPETIKTTKQKRREREKKIEKQGGDTPYPGWQALRAERSEEDPAVVLTIRDDKGRVVSKLEGPAEAGFHRVAWDLRYPESSPWTDKPENNYIVMKGPLAAPGNYTVSMATRINGELKDTGQQTGIGVKLMRQNSLATASPEEVVAFSLRLDELLRKASGAESAIKMLLGELKAVKQTLPRSGAQNELRTRTRALELELMDLQLALAGDATRDLANAGGPVSIKRRLNVAQMGTAFSSYGPAPMHERSLEIAEKAFAGVQSSLERIFGSEVPALREDLKKAGVPWTPGRAY